MLSAPLNESNRDTSRYVTCTGMSVDGTLWSDSLDCQCEILDLNAGGCCVRFPIKVLPNSRCPELPMALIRVEDPSLEIHIQAIGHVRWSRQATMDSWSLGIEFHKPLYPAMLERLVKSGRIDRRRSPRTTTLIPVSVRRQFGKDAIGKANIHERSANGLRLWTDLELEPEEQIVLTLPDGKISMCTVKRIAASHDGYESGCSFANAASGRAVMHWTEA